MYTIKVENSFHHTSVTLKAEVGDVLTDNQVKKVLSGLCGVKGCTCGALSHQQDAAHAIAWQDDSRGNTTYYVVR